MTYRLYLDDVREPPWAHCHTVVARNAAKFRAALLEYGCPELISFDHDLGSNQPTGLDCAKMLAKKVLDKQIELPNGFVYTVHSMNHVGRDNIEGFMATFLKLYKDGEYGAIRSLL